jgi:hypothetical protein
MYIAQAFLCGLVGWLVGWLVGCELVAVLAGQLAGWLAASKFIGLHSKCDGFDSCVEQ